MMNTINSVILPSVFTGFVRDIVETARDFLESVRSIPETIRATPETARKVPWGRVALAILAAAGLSVLASAAVFAAMIGLMVLAM